MKLSLYDHLLRQMAFSRATFGPGPRVHGVLDHAEKEIEEIRRAHGSPEEWTDLVLLALDGLTRSLQYGKHRAYPEAAAEMACRLISEKQGANERRDWPDWRTADPNKAIEHVRGQGHEAAK